MTNMNKFRDPAVYGLHAGDGTIRYVGATRVNSTNRLWEHNYRANTGHTAPVYAWMRLVGVENVHVVDLEKVPNLDDLLEVEASWITRLLAEGADLVNDRARDGYAFSNGPHMRSASSATKRGRPTWIKGKRGEDAGWTDERRAHHREIAEKKRLNRVPRHGTAHEYNKYGCRCDDCRAAALSPRKPVEKHGRYLYKRDGCRCDTCVEANRVYSTEWARKRREEGNVITQLAA